MRETEQDSGVETVRLGRDDEKDESFKGANSVKGKNSKYTLTIPRVMAR